jgi:hypothetical protein
MLGVKKILLFGGYVKFVKIPTIPTEQTYMEEYERRNSLDLCIMSDDGRFNLHHPQPTAVQALSLFIYFNGTPFYCLI